MSYTEDQLKAAVRQAVEQALANQGQQPSRSRESHSTMEQIDSCPECRKAYKSDEFKAKTLRQTWEERKNLHMKCKDCGFPVKTERDGFPKEAQDETCPNCNSHGAEDRYV